MRPQMEGRLEELRAELATGQKMLAEMDEKRERLRESMLRIAGAIQVLEELMGEGEREEEKEKSGAEP